MGAFLNGLTAFANFGTGYDNTQRQNTQDSYINQMHAMSLHNAQQEQQQNDLKMKNQQALSDASMAQSAGLAPSGGAMPGQGPQQDPSNGGQGDAPQQFDAVKYFNNMTQAAASMGDFSAAGMFNTQSANAATARMGQQQKQAAVEAAGLKRIQAAHSTVAQILGNPDITTPEQFEQAKLEVLSNPIAMSDPEEAKTLANLHWSPGITDRIRNTGLTSAQQATDKLKQLKDAQDATHQKMMEDNNTQKLNLERQRAAAQEEHWKNQTKAGATEKAPSPQELKVAAPLIAKVWFPDDPNAATSNGLFQGPAYDPGDTGKDSGHFKEPKYDFSSIPVTTIVSRAKQAMLANRALTFPRAVQQQSELAMKSGEFQQTKTPAKPGGFLGVGSEPAKTSSKFNTGTGTPADPYVFHGQPKEELEDGKTYKTMSGDMIWSKTGWIHP